MLLWAAAGGEAVSAPCRTRTQGTGHQWGGSTGLCVVGVRACLRDRFIRWASMGMWDPCLDSAQLNFPPPCTSRHWCSPKPAPLGVTLPISHKVSRDEATASRVKKPF